MRQILLTAQKLGMDGGDFAFIGVQLFRNTRSVDVLDWLTAESDKHNRRITVLPKVYQSLLMISVRIPVSTEHQQFVEEVVARSRSSFNQSYHEESVNSIISGFHDSVLIYGAALNETLATGGDPNDGEALARRLWNRTFAQKSMLMSGDIVLNENGDRDTNFVLTDLDPVNLRLVDVFTFYGAENVLVANGHNIHWPNGRGPPLDTPATCFFKDEIDCRSDRERRLLLASFLAIMLILSAICVFVGIAIYRKLRFESQLASHWWRVRAEDILAAEGSERSFEHIGAGLMTSSPVLGLGFVSTPQSSSQVEAEEGSSTTIRLHCPRPQPSPLQALLVVTASSNTPTSAMSTNLSPAPTDLAARKGIFRVRHFEYRKHLCLLQL